MNILKRIWNTASTSISDLLNPKKWLISALSGGRLTTSGEHVSPESAMTLSAYFACLRCISEDVGKLPLIVYKEVKPRGRERLINSPIYNLLKTKPNNEMSSISFRETLQHWAMGWGNGYAEIVRDGGGVAREMYPIHPSRVTVIRDTSGEILYRVRPSIDLQTGAATGKGDRYLRPDEMFHLHGLGKAGIDGYSIAGLAAESLGVGLAAQKFGAAFFGNGTSVGGILSHPGKLSDPAIEKLKKAWNEAHQGAGNAHGLAVLEEGLKYDRTSIPPEDAQFIETRQFSVEDVCRWFRVPPHKIQHLLRATFSNIEQQSIEYVVDCLMPWLERWEQEIKRKLIGENETEVYAKHLINGLMRGDQAARAAFYKALFEMGALSPNDIRELEDMNPIEDGDNYYVQLNLTTLKNAGQPQPTKAVTVVPPDKEKK